MLCICVDCEYIGSNHAKSTIFSIQKCIQNKVYLYVLFYMYRSCSFKCINYNMQSLLMVVWRSLAGQLILLCECLYHSNNVQCQTQAKRIACILFISHFILIFFFLDLFTRSLLCYEAIHNLYTYYSYSCIFIYYVLSEI